MGGSSSKTSVDIVNDAIIDAITSNANNCSSQTTQVQDVEHTGFGLFTGAEQTLNVTTQCLQKVVVDNSMVAQMAQNIQQQAAANTVALLPGFSSSRSDTNLKNYLETKITTQNVQNCANSVDQYQRARFGGVQVGVYDQQSMDAFHTCMADTLNKNNVAEGIVQNVNQSSSASTDSSPLSQFVSALTTTLLMPLILLIILVFVIAIIYVVFNHIGGPAPVEEIPMPMPSPTGPPVDMGPTPGMSMEGLPTVEQMPPAGPTPGMGPVMQ